MKKPKTKLREKPGFNSERSDYLV